MALKVLPNDVRSILCASAQINNYKTAIEELVNNCLDADSTSIAIRINIQENRIQVVDNGYGMDKIDLKALGQRYMTSKITDLSTLKSMPKCYGYRGEFFANIIEISQNVKVISRLKDSDETWAKTFHEGKNKPITKMTTRPSKGTTVEIIGFLYNLNIQKRGIDPINDLQNIKLFLEQLSLVHNDISLSLRDDSKNEIFFKINKKRDIYQTLSTLFNIEKTSVQELQVEKNQYKVKAFIGQRDIEIGRQWIYLNGKFIQNSNLHKIVNEYLKKYVCAKDKKKSKSKKNYDEEYLFNKNIPFYFLFITCPYIDYDIITNRRQSAIEFKNWEQIKKILEKVIKFYIGDVSLKEINKSEPTVKVQQDNHKGNDNTRNQIKKIIDKILGSNSKRLGVSKLQNGVKGKLIKRKSRKRTKKEQSQKLLLKIDEQKCNEHNKDMATDKSILDIYSDGNNKERNVTKCNHFNDQFIQEIPKTTLHKNSPIIQNSIKSNTNVKTLKVKRTKKKNHKRTKETSRTKPHRNMEINKLNIVKPKKITNIMHKNEHFNAIQTLADTDTIPRKSRLVAQEVEEFLKHQKKYQIVQKKNKVLMNTPARYKYRSNDTRLNADKNVMYRIKTNPFKTTYDLVQTILETQPENKVYTTNYSFENRFKRCPAQKRRGETSKYKNVIRKPLKPSVQISDRNLSENINIECRLQQQAAVYDSMSRNMAFYQSTYEDNSSNGRYTQLEYGYKSSINHNSSEALPLQSLRCEDLFKENPDLIYVPHDPSPYLSNNNTIPLLTYDSHKCGRGLINVDNYININNNRYVSRGQSYGQELFNVDNYRNNNNRYANKGETFRFITKQSRDNFIGTGNKYKSMFKCNFKSRHEKHRHNKQNNSRGYVRQTDESYTIEFTKSNDTNCSILVSNQSNFVVRNDNDGIPSIDSMHSPNYEPTGFGNTYTVPTYTISSDLNKFNTLNETKKSGSNKLFVANSISYTSDKRQNGDISNYENHNTNNDVNIVFVSKSQRSNTEVILEEDSRDIEPLNLCETILGTDNGTIVNEFAHSFNRGNRLDDSLYNNFGESNLHNAEKYKTQTISVQKKNENVSHHFSNTFNLNTNMNGYIQANEQDEIEHNTQGFQILNDQHKGNKLIQLDNANSNNFDIKDRLRFLPKGMSQIFEKCGSKTICDYNLDQDYYEDAIYDDFANDVQVQTEVYEPVIQNVEDLTTKDIHKFKNKVQKDNTALVFDEQSLREAQVLNQVDGKFIAAIIKEKYKETIISSEYFVLFDQHAVHERIRLEQNLADYIIEDKWQSVALDNITMKITQDKVLYLHNYKDKFLQLGLQWTIINKDEISISAIPEAILGKNPREVDKVMKAVNNLIVEEINVIKIQKGCISLYPKSIMDLVFSEACRYAIKFGDKLSKSDCIDLLQNLSNCKTPFQCAHGRPVMAVMLKTESVAPDYKIDIASLRRYKLNKTKSLGG